MFFSCLAAALWAGLVGGVQHSAAGDAAAAIHGRAKEHAGTVVVTHPDHPDYRLTMIPHSADNDSSIAEVCPGATDGYTGYLDAPDEALGGMKHFYFAYFRSRSQPSTDPLVMWLNGGPGCSSMLGMLMELGPCLTDDGGKTAHENKDSWINVANVFFLDQPIAVGFSYHDNSSWHADDSFAAAKDVYTFMKLWYHRFPETRPLPFSIAGESYAGHYIPIFANHIIDMNKIASAEAQIPLESVLIGNGLFTETIQASSIYDISCTNATGVGPLLNEFVCSRMMEAVPQCEHLMKACDEYKDLDLCVHSAEAYCDDSLVEPFRKSADRNPYDVSRPCGGARRCYEEVGWIQQCLNSSQVRKAFGVYSDTCHQLTGMWFASNGDRWVDTRPFVKNLLHSDIRVLIYLGTYDMVCNFVGNERVFISMDWKGQPDFRYQQENNKQVWAGGLWWESGPLRYVRINQAGHMVPYDKPKEALQMFKAWLDKEPLV